MVTSSKKWNPAGNVPGPFFRIKSSKPVVKLLPEDVPVMLTPPNVTSYELLFVTVNVPVLDGHDPRNPVPIIVPKSNVAGATVTFRGAFAVLKVQLLSC